MDVEKIVSNASRLGEEKSSLDILRKSMSIFLLTKDDWRRKIIFFFIELVVAYGVARKIDTIILEEKIIVILHDVIIALFGIVFTGYTLFQALISDRLLIEMIQKESANFKYKSYIEESNAYFAEIMMAQFLVIIIDIGIRIFVGVVPCKWVLFSSNAMNEFVAGIVILMSLYLNIEIIWETKSFIFNMFQLFNAHAMVRIMDIVEKYKNY